MLWIGCSLGSFLHPSGADGKEWDQYQTIFKPAPGPQEDNSSCGYGNSAGQVILLDINHILEVTKSKGNITALANSCRDHLSVSLCCEFSILGCSQKDTCLAIHQHMWTCKWMCASKFQFSYSISSLGTLWNETLLLVMNLVLCPISAYE